MRDARPEAGAGGAEPGAPVSVAPAGTGTGAAAANGVPLAEAGGGAGAPAAPPADLLKDEHIAVTGGRGRLWVYIGLRGRVRRLDLPWRAGFSAAVAGAGTDACLGPSSICGLLQSWCCLSCGGLSKPFPWLPRTSLCNFRLCWVRRQILAEGQPSKAREAAQSGAGGAELAAVCAGASECMPA
jgi:hypothetical protein